MALLYELFGFLSVVLRVVAITAQSLTVGGIAFLLLLAQRAPAGLALENERVLQRSRTLLLASALVLAGGEALDMAMQVSILVATTELPLHDALAAGFSIAAFVKIGAALVLAALAHPPLHGMRAVASGLAAVVILVAATATSHAISRLDDRLALAALTFLHQLAASIWLGGIPYFLVALARSRDGVAWRWVGRRFSLMSMASVGVLFAAGFALSLAFIGSIEAIYGTTYGVMVTTKFLLFAGLLFLGGMNFRTVERLRQDPMTPILRLRRFAEAEIGIGIAAFCVAASLTSLPPATDLPEDRVSLAEIVERFRPEWPRFASPSHDDLAIPALQAKLDTEAAAKGAVERPQAFTVGTGEMPPSNAADRAWSEYNHHWAGVIVLLIGLVALGEKSGSFPWGRHWPLLFLLLAVFLFFRSDPEAWPLGEIGFIESFRDSGIVQHRLFVVLIVAFGIFEWRVRTGRMRSPRAALVFPLITAVAGALLLLHSHALANVKDQMLVELSHAPLAVCGIAAGWARWLELRLPPPGNRVAGWVWPACFVLVALVLLDYRES
jgi:putative copper resistance protein D